MPPRGRGRAGGRRARGARPRRPRTEAPAGETGAAAGAGARAAATPQAAGGGDGALDWERTVAALPLKGLAAELASNTALVGLDGNRLRLALGAEHAHLGTDRYRERLEAALGEHLGRTLRVELVTEAAAGGETPAQAEARRSESRREEARAAIDGDPVVQAFRERFDARVQADSVEPARDDAHGGRGNE
ncbi:MAG: DNA polymerase III subunit gamma/tau C-terminal domain-containing protein [Halofilum sp. (in: g-proteobacteria)]|nr:DNA polymerase III subunit gamma/tau C-terminal domain-containing protein [Halofilum sp. (in: g-proteobacteria)]